METSDQEFDEDEEEPVGSSEKSDKKEDYMSNREIKYKLKKFISNKNNIEIKNKVEDILDEDDKKKYIAKSPDKRFGKVSNYF
jgi:hypothetical protein